MESPASVVSWPHVLVTAIVAGFTATLTYLLKRKKLPSEVHKTDAEADFAQAQADDIRFKNRLSATEMFSEMAADLGELQFEKIQLKRELMRANEQNKVLENEVQRFKAERMLDRLGPSSGERSDDDPLVQ